MTSAGRTRSSSDSDGSRTSVSRGLMTTAVTVLSVALMVLLGLRVSTDPLPGDLAWDLVQWGQQVLSTVGAVLLAAAVTLRRLGR